MSASSEESDKSRRQYRSKNPDDYKVDPRCPKCQEMTTGGPMCWSHPKYPARDKVENNPGTGFDVSPGQYDDLLAARHIEGNTETNERLFNNAFEDWNALSHERQAHLDAEAHRRYPSPAKRLKDLALQGAGVLATLPLDPSAMVATTAAALSLADYLVDEVKISSDARKRGSVKNTASEFLPGLVEFVADKQNVSDPYTAQKGLGWSLADRLADGFTITVNRQVEELLKSRGLPIDDLEFLPDHGHNTLAI